MWLYIAGGVIAVAFIIGLIYSIKRNQKINANGVETEAVVSRIKEIESRDSDGAITTSYEYYVRYRSETGETVEAKLGNAPRRVREGDTLRVKYLPEKPKFALVVKDKK